MMIVDKDDFTMPGKDRPPQSFLDLRTQQGQINWLAQFLMSVNAAFDDLEVTATIETGDEMSVTTEYDEETKTLTFHFVFTGSGGGGYVLPTMSAEVKGGAKVGSGLAMTGEALGLEGVSFTQAEKTKLAGIDEGANDYTLPTMSAEVKGGAMAGPGLSVLNETIKVDLSTVDTGALPVARGGTGGTTVSAALASLGAASQSDLDEAEQAIADNAAAIVSINTALVPESMKTLPLTLSGATGQIKYHKYGRVCEVIFENIIPNKSGTVVLATLPEGYRPGYNAQPYIRRATSGISACWIPTNGDINLIVLEGSETTAYAGFVVFIS